MGAICPCPKRNKKPAFAYDVHEETFQMDEDMQNNHSLPKIDGKYLDNILSEDMRDQEDEHRGQRSNQILTDNQQMQFVESQKSLIQNEATPLNKEFDHDALVEENQKRAQQFFGQSAEKKESAPIMPPVEVPILKAHPNILKPKKEKPKYNPDDYRFKQETNSFRIKKLKSLNEQQFNIESCKDCQFYIFDLTANVYVDNSENCIIYVAPCQSTIFIRNCRNITMIAATKQFRTVNCFNCTFSLYCSAQPVIQSSADIEFCSFSFPTYEQLPAQFSKFKFQIWNNHWSEIHDFTKKTGESHFSLLPENTYLNKFNWKKAFEEAQLRQIDQLVVPHINGELPYEPIKQILLLLQNGVAEKQIVEAIKPFKMLRALKSKAAMEGQFFLIISLDVKDKQHNLDQLGRICTEKDEIEAIKSRNFIVFLDQREK